MDIDYLIDRLEALITAGKRVPLSNKVMVDEQECLDLIDQMRAVVPEEVKAAKRTLLDRERILNDAEEDARQVLEHAEQQRDTMLSQKGLMAEAEVQSAEIISQAEQVDYDLRTQAQSLYDEAVGQTQDMREGANSYTMQVLQELENLLGKHLNMVRNGLQSFQQQAQQYQEQMDSYQRQNRPNYAPSGPPPETRLTTTANRPRPTAKTNGASPASPTERRPASTAAPQPQPPERKPNPPAPASNNPVGPRKVTPPSTQTQLPNRATPPSNPGSSSLASRNINPVPKPTRPNNDDDQNDLDDDPFFNPDPKRPGPGTSRFNNRD